MHKYRNKTNKTKSRTVKRRWSPQCVATTTTYRHGHNTARWEKAHAGYANAVHSQTSRTDVHRFSICLWFTGVRHNYLGSQKYIPPLINAGRPSHLSFYKWARCAAKLMIYEFTRATIKHNFPWAVLMTWWERYFIKAAAPGLDTETEAVGAGNKISSSNWCKLQGWWMVDDREARGREGTGNEEAATLIAHCSSSRGVVAQRGCIVGDSRDGVTVTGKH